MPVRAGLDGSVQGERALAGQAGMHPGRVLEQRLHAAEAVGRRARTLQGGGLRGGGGFRLFGRHFLFRICHP